MNGAAAGATNPGRHQRRRRPGRPSPVFRAPIAGGDFPTMPHAAMQQSRSFIDGQGVQWRVTERPVRPALDAPARACLFFEAAHIIRRVCAYPDNWRDLPDAELERLSWRL